MTVENEGRLLLQAMGCTQDPFLMNERSTTEMIAIVVDRDLIRKLKIRSTLTREAPHRNNNRRPGLVLPGNLE